MYGGTKEEMERLLKKAQEISGFKYDISSYADIVEAIHVVQNELGITGTTAKEADSTIQGSLAATKAAWDNVMVAISGGNIDLGESIDALVESGINTINNIWPVISRALKGVGELVKQVAPIIAENLPGMVQDVLPNLLDAAITLLGGVAAALPGLFQVVLDAVGELFEQLKIYIDEKNPELGGAIDSIGAFFDNVGQTISTVWTNLSPVFDGLKGALDTVIAALNGDTEAINTLKEAFNTILPIVIGATAAFAAYKTVVAISTVIDAVRNSTTLLTIAQTALNAVMNANPFAIIASLIAAISAALITAYNTNEDFRNKVDAAWESVKRVAETVFNAVGGFITDVIAAFSEIPENIQSMIDSAQKWGTNIIANFWTSINNAWSTAIEYIKGLFKQIPEAIQEIIDSALNWGRDLIDNFKKGIEEKWEGLKQKVSDVAGSIKDFLGFSVPEKGPLSDFDTYSPDMMDLFIRGIQDSMYKLQTTIDAVAENVVSKFQRMGENAVTAFTTALSNLSSYVRSAFDFSGIHVKTPHFYVSRYSNIGNVMIPSFGVQWYRKAYDNPIMFTSPTVLSTTSGLKGFGDGNGGEIVLSDKKLREIAGNGATYNNTFNVYAQPGQDAEEIAREVQKIFVSWDNQAKAVFA